MGRSPLVLSPLLLIPLLVTPTVAQPETPRKPVTTTYHGVDVTDDYRWLEDPEDAAVQKWWADQNKHSRAFFNRLPELPGIRKRVDALSSDEPPSFERVQYAN